MKAQRHSQGDLGALERRFPDRLWLLSAENTVGTYPDTGESGDAYDAEAVVDCWPLESQGLVVIVNSLL